MNKWTVDDYFDHKSGSQAWQSSDPNDSPYDSFTCKICGYTFSEMMYGTFQHGEDPWNEVEEKMQFHLSLFHKAELK